MNTQTESKSYLSETRALVSAGPLAWLTTLDHKRLGVSYLVVTLLAVVAAGVSSVALHRDLAASTLFAFLFLVPSITAALGTFVLPIQLGQKSAALPRVSLAGFGLHVVGAVVIALGLVVTEGGKPAPSGLLPIVGGALVLSLGMTLTSVNILATTAKAAFGGAPDSRITLFAWSLCATSIATILGFLALVGRVTIVGLAEIHLPQGFSPYYGFVPQDVVAHVLAHPWANLAPFGTLVLVPAIGVVSDVFVAFTGRKRLVGYAFVATSMAVLAFLGLLEWVAPILGVGDTDSPLKVGFATSVAALALVVVVLSWVMTLRGGRIVVAAPLVWALGCLFQLTIGGPAAVILGVPASGAYLHDTIFEVGYHHVLTGGATLGFVAGLSYFWPKITGRRYDGRLSLVAFVLVFVGLQMAFLTELLRGLSPESTGLESASTYGAWVLAAGGAAALLVFLASLRSPATAGDNPWGAAGGLEWTTPSPPPLDNFLRDPDADLPRRAPSRGAEKLATASDA